MSKLTFFKTERFFTKAELNYPNTLNRDEIISYDMALFPRNHDDEAVDLGTLLHLPLENDEQIIVYFLNPVESYENRKLEGEFIFCGYDLCEEFSGISAILNCGGHFDKSIPPDDLNQYGLIKDLHKAYEIARILRNDNPDENHANCEVYELWRWL